MRLRLPFRRVFLLLFLIPGLLSASSAAAQSDCRGNELDSPGLISSSEYEGPMFGNTVSWGDMWEVGEMSNARVAEVVGEFSQPVDCEGNTGDLLTLVHRLSPSTVLKIQTYQQGLWTFEEMEKAMEHPGWINNLGMWDGGDVLLNDSSGTRLAMLARDSADPAHLAYGEIHFPEGEDFIMVYTLHTWDESALSPVLGDLRRSVEIDGMPLFAVHDRGEILDAAE